VPVSRQHNERSYVCVRGIDFASLGDIYLEFWKCSDSVVFFSNLLPLYSYMYLCIQCITITKFVSSNPAHGEVYPIQHYVIQIVSSVVFGTCSCTSSYHTITTTPYIENKSSSHNGNENIDCSPLFSGKQNSFVTNYDSLNTI
jgi:hypothetical protein